MLSSTNLPLTECLESQGSHLWLVSTISVALQVTTSPPTSMTADQGQTDTDCSGQLILDTNN